MDPLIDLEKMNDAVNKTTHKAIIILQAPTTKTFLKTTNLEISPRSLAVSKRTSGTNHLIFLTGNYDCTNSNVKHQEHGEQNVFAMGNTVSPKDRIVAVRSMYV